MKAPLKNALIEYLTTYKNLATARATSATVDGELDGASYNAAMADAFTKALEYAASLEVDAPPEQQPDSIQTPGEPDPAPTPDPVP